jgi:peptidoglycan/LPS O-acetylase OafA/YrhL
MNFFYKPYAFISIYIVDFPPALLPLYASYFALGVYASFQKWFMDNERKEHIYPWTILYLLSLIFSIGMFVVMSNSAEINNPLMAFFYTASIFSGVMLLLTIFKRFFNKPLKRLAWFSQNSYGMYILHYFILFLTVYLMRELQWPVMIKFIVQCIFCPCVIWVLSASLKKFTPLRHIL